MKTTDKEIAAKLLVLLMIGVMGLQVANQALFLHVHKLENGTIIEHAHPYDKSNDPNPYKSHKHSNAEFSFIQNLEILFHVIIPILTFIIVFVRLEKVFSRSITNQKTISKNIYKGRAPPIS